MLFWWTNNRSQYRAFKVFYPYAFVIKHLLIWTMWRALLAQGHHTWANSSVLKTCLSHYEQNSTSSAAANAGLESFAGSAPCTLPRIVIKFYVKNSISAGLGILWTSILFVFQILLYILLIKTTHETDNEKLKCAWHKSVFGREKRHSACAQ